MWRSRARRSSQLPAFQQGKHTNTSGTRRQETRAAAVTVIRGLKGSVKVQGRLADAQHLSQLGNLPKALTSQRRLGSAV